jgi:hypothetical protein
MYSNFITPPDFVDDNLHTVTVINASTEEIASLARMCQTNDEMFNVYLYHNGMKNTAWLQEAIDRSETVIIKYANPLVPEEKMYCYGDSDITDYFLERSPTK